MQPHTAALTPYTSEDGSAAAQGRHKEEMPKRKHFMLTLLVSVNKYINKIKP